MSSVEIRNKTENTSPAGDEWLFTQDSDSPYTVKKMSLETMGTYVATLSDNVVGSTIRTESTLIPISASFPWLCLSYPSVDLTTTNYSSEFITALRARKYIYDEFSTNTSAFSGSWSSNVFTLTDNTANNAMLAELAEDWLYHGSPTSNWRIINDGTTDFKMTTMDVTARTITVDLDSETATGTSIIIYTNRVYRDATKARHFSEAGLATYQAGGGKSGRLFRRDQMQGHKHEITVLRHTGSLTLLNSIQVTPANGSTLAQTDTWATDATLTNDGTNGTPRTGSETRSKSSSRYEYIYVGSYTA